MMDGENIVINSSVASMNFCAILKGLNIIYMELSQIGKQKVLLVQATDGGGLRTYRVFATDETKNWLDEIADFIGEQKSLFQAYFDEKSTVFLNEDFWLEPIIDEREFRCRVYEKDFRIKSLEPTLFEKIIYVLYYKQVFFNDSSWTLEQVGDAIYLGDRLIITPEDWGAAITTQQFKDGLAFNLDYDMVDEAILGVYRAREAVARLGAPKLKQIFRRNLPIRKEFYRFLASFKLEMASRVSELQVYSCQKVLTEVNRELGENLSRKYADFKILNIDDGATLAELFAVPRVRRFSDVADAQIIEDIMSNKINSDLIEYYLRNYLFMEREKALARLFEVASKIIVTTKKDGLFRVANTIMGEIRRALPGGGRQTNLFEEAVYKVYLSRIGGADGLERIIRWAVTEEAAFRDEGWSNEIAVEAARQIFKVKPQVVQLDKKVWKIVEDMTKLTDLEIRVLPEWVKSYVFNVKYAEMAVGEKIRRAVKIFDAEQVAVIFGEPKTLEEARIVMDDLFGGNEEGDFIRNREKCLEQILLSTRVGEVRKYCLGRMLTDYEDFTERFGDERVFFFTAACEGARDVEELEVLESLSVKFLETEHGERNAWRIQKAKELARIKIETRKLQREGAMREDFTKKIDFSKEI